ncbi:hypothetical protein K1719_042907 [Acacia pycnantha]|nr:hypothetical protein K1719_042907 [Acacia pycnantha]
MGGSCCSPPKETETSDPQPSFNNPRASEQPVLLSSDRGSASASSGGPRVDANLETSTPVPSSSDTMAITQTLLRAREISDDKTNASLQSANPNSVEDIASTSRAHVDREEMEPDSADDSENELQNVEENDGCPICLEGYNAVNPKERTQCGHHFHFACILDWKERRNNCPVCDRDMVFDLFNDLGL